VVLTCTKSYPDLQDHTFILVYQMPSFLKARQLCILVSGSQTPLTEAGFRIAQGAPVSDVIKNVSDLPRRNGNVRLIPKLVAGVVAAGLATACSAQKPPDPTMGDLVRTPEFQQCLLDAGIQPRQLSDCLVANPDEESLRACLQADLGEKSGSNSDALYRCYHPPPPIQTGVEMGPSL
jgi:hypothetical protein